MTIPTINIMSAHQVGDDSLHLVFDDSREETVDFRPFLSPSRHPDIRQWLEPARIASFTIAHGELVWGGL